MGDTIGLVETACFETKRETERVLKMSGQAQDNRTLDTEIRILAAEMNRLANALENLAKYIDKKKE